MGRVLCKLCNAKEYWDVFCTKHVTVRLCTPDFAQNTSQYHFVVQNLRKARPSATLYHQACAKHVPAPICDRKLHKGRPTANLHYKVCAKHVRVLLCIRKVAQSTSQYPFVLQSTSQDHLVLQSLHEARSSPAMYCQVCTKHVPVLLCTMTLAQNNTK